MSDSLVDLELDLSIDTERGLLRRLDWSSFWTSCLIALIVYFVTLGPSVSLEDSGELAVAGDHLGVPHPPGYPIWTMLAWTFARVFSFVTFRGMPTPAWSISLLSAVFGALAIGITAMLITRVGSDILAFSRKEDEEKTHANDKLIAWVAGVSGSLIFAFSPVMWSQSTIVEVYTLNAFFLMLIFLLTYLWMRRPSNKLLLITAFIFGLGMTNYQVLLLAMLPLVIVVMLRDMRLFRDFFMAGIPFLLAYVILKLGAETESATFTKQINPNGLNDLFMDNAIDSDRLSSAADYSNLGMAYANMCRNGIEGLYKDPASMGRYFLPLVKPGIYVSAIWGGMIAAAGALILRFRPQRNKKALYEFEGDSAWMVAGGVAVALGLLISMISVARLPEMRTFVTIRGSASPVPFSWLSPSLMFFLGLSILLGIGSVMRRGIWYAVSMYAIFVPMFFFMHRGAMMGMFHPSSGWFAFYIVMNFVILALIWVMLPHGRTVALSFLLVELGVAFYIYMPIVSDLRNPPMNWGYPRTWEGFKHALKRGQYAALQPVNPITQFPIFLKQVVFYFSEMRMQFTLFLAPLGILPFAVWHFRDETGRRVRALYLATGLYVAVGIFVLLFKYFELGESATSTFNPALWLSWLMLALAAVGTVSVVTNQVKEQFNNVLDEARSLSERVMSGLLVLGAGCIMVLVPMFFWYQGFKGDGAGSNGALLIFALVLTCTVAGAVALAILRPADFKVGLEPLMQKWFIASAVGFVAMSIVLVALANPKCDVQDAFIQKVKFISSHGLFALWIGYGIAMGLGALSRITKGNKNIVYIAAIGALLLPLIPVRENYFNDRLIKLYSAAEQNGCDFGWQFGNYQLRGAEAINEELDEGEEPLPNPYYPEGMEQDAIFFGGTDPGRFVPTYMIYSAKVREDVFLITQNALADHTYMSVMRDLYGEKIWIPSPAGSQNAFKIYVDELEAGKRPRNAGVNVINGRVQVTGALGVMEINGILCDMMFKKNKSRHAFYVEESYPIRWMFPYMTPHGLILKLNNEKCRISQRNTTDDMDLWDWYMRRHTSDRSFRRDIVAQKSFSKLRSAIAGLYARRNYVVNAERAFIEARMMYEFSPESALRLSQEVYLPRRLYRETIRVLERLHEIDPNNAKIVPLLDHVRKIMHLGEKARDLEEISKQGNLTMTKALELMEVYHAMGDSSSLHRLALRLLNVKTFTSAHAVSVADKLQKAKLPKQSIPFIDHAMKTLKAGSPPENYISISTLYIRAENKAGAKKALLLAENALLPTTAPSIVRAISKQYVQLNDAGSMARNLQRYLQSEPTDWEAWLDMAMAQLLMKQPQNAEMAIKEALRCGGVNAKRRIQEHPYLKSFYDQMNKKKSHNPISGPGSWR